MTRLSSKTYLRISGLYERRLDLGHISHSVNLKTSENSDVGLFILASDDSDLDSMSGEESVLDD